METNITEKGRERTGQDETYMYSMELDRWDRKEIEGTDGMRKKEMDETRQEVLGTGQNGTEWEGKRVEGKFRYYSSP